jgi:ERO1-like protein alpha
MNCVECEKCKVWGKLQSYGIGNFFILGTALKIIFENHIPARNELIAFINTFNKITHSVIIIDSMF